VRTKDEKNPEKGSEIDLEKKYQKLNKYTAQKLRDFIVRFEKRAKEFK